MPLEEVVALLGTMPECGRTCLLNTIAVSPCQAGNTTCTCENAEITAVTQACVLESCSVKHQLTTKNVTETICQRPIRDKRGPGLKSIIAGLVIATVALGLRMASKIHSPCAGNDGWSTTLWWDDAVVVFVLALAIPIDVSAVLLSHAGIGTDVWTLPFENITRILKIYYWDEDLYLTALPAVKISLLLTYLRIFQSRNFRRVVYLVIALNVCYAISFVLVSVFQCLPVSCAWNKWSGEYPCKCNNINAQGWASAGANVGLDVLTLSLPLPQLWAMQLNKRKKFWLMLMFCVGFLVTIISILRLQVLIQFGDSFNLTYDYVSVGYWSTAELHLSVVCASMPSIRNLLRRYVPYVMGQSTTDTNRGSRSGGGGGIGNHNASGLSTTAQNSTTRSGKSVKNITIRTMDSDEENFISLDDYHAANRTAPLQHVGDDDYGGGGAGAARMVGRGGCSGNTPPPPIEVEEDWSHVRPHHGAGAGGVGGGNHLATASEEDAYTRRTTLTDTVCTVTPEEEEQQEIEHRGNRGKKGRWRRWF
ncbi:SAT4 family membrane protein [Sphaerulina musiva]